MELNKYIDHTILKATASQKDIEKLCAEATEHKFYSVCVNGCYVKNAKKYLKEVLRELDGDFILTGHSKGGNLAAYAASQVNPLLQERIKKIYSYDAPGLNKVIIESDGYKAIANKIQHYIPQGSIVGMMLEIPKQMAIVKSTALGGLAQHDTFSWQIEGDSFVLLDSLSR